MDDSIADAVDMETQEAYVCPRRSDWPVYDNSRGEYVESSGDTDLRESMLELSAPEATSPQLAEVYVDYRKERGKLSKDPTFNYKKNSALCELSGYWNRFTTVV